MKPQIKPLFIDETELLQELTYLWFVASYPPLSSSTPHSLVIAASSSHSPSSTRSLWHHSASDYTSRVRRGLSLHNSRKAVCYHTSPSSVYKASTRSLYAQLKIRYRILDCVHLVREARQLELAYRNALCDGYGWFSELPLAWATPQ